jgi:predicted ribonuclease YlaK
MIFYDTCSLLNGYETIFKQLEEPFAISNITLMEIEAIKTSKAKDNEIKHRARKLSALLNFYSNKYNIVNYQKDWDSIYLEPNPILLENNDSRIIISALVYSEKNPDLVFITNDLNCNNLARSVGLTTNLLTREVDSKYTGYFVKTCMSEDDVAETYDRIYNGDNFGLLINQYLLIEHDGKIIDSFVFRENKLEQIQFSSFKSKMFGEVKPLDPYQKIAMDSLKNNIITMLRGHAGVGKSYLAMGYLFECLEAGKIDHIVIFCNTVATANAAKLGYYPGDRTEKLLDSQIGNFLVSKLGDRTQVERMIAEGDLILLPMSDIRGFDTTGMRAGVYITEAQNLNIELMKLALQRIGDDAICILDGDADSQVDLDAYSGCYNGMKRASKIFRNHDCYGEVTLPICHRSKIATIAENM